MGNKWSRSMAIARQSVNVLRGNPSLMAFPIVTALVSMVISVSFFVPVYFFYTGHKVDQIPPFGYAIMAVYYLISYFVVIFFNVGLASCTYASLRGERPGFMDGIRYASGRMGPILGWTVLAATVGMLLQMASERLGIVGKIIVGLIGGAWNIVTFLVVPILAVEGKGPVDSVKDSANLLKRTWGEQLIGTGGVGFVFGMCALIPIVPLIAVMFTGSVPLIVGLAIFSVIYWIGLAILGASVSGVYQTALYVYATTGAPPAGFDAAGIASAFGPRPQGKVERIIRERF
jgi:hypothetical protein